MDLAVTHLTSLLFHSVSVPAGARKGAAETIDSPSSSDPDQ
jgi:hypothetical protein